MAKHERRSTQARRREKRQRRGYRTRPAEGGHALELVPSPDALDRRDDLEEVRRMLAAGEIDVAVDELRWLIAGCHDFMDAHRLLGQVAFEDGDWDLAQAHFGKAYEIGLEAVGPSPSLPLSHKLPGNEAFFAAGRGLMRCLDEQGKKKRAEEVRDTLLNLDPTAPVLLEG